MTKVEHAKQTLTAKQPFEAEQTPVGLKKVHLAQQEGAVCLAKGNQASRCVKHGGPVALLLVYGQWQMDRIDRQPRLDGRKAGLGLLCLPWQGRPGTIPA